MAVTGYNSGFGQDLVIIQWIFTAISVIVVGLRMVSAKLKHGFKISEGVILVALGIEIAFTVVCTVGVGYGVGANWNELSPWYQMESMKWGVISNSVAVWTFSVPKLALCFLLHSLLCPGRLALTLLYGSTVLLMCFSLILSVLFYEQCDPVNSQWDHSVAGTCLNPNVLSDIAIFTGSYSAFLDFALAAYPAWVVIHLEMSLARRLSIAGILSLGLVAAAITAYKCKKLGALLSNPNPSYETAELLLWTNIESNVVIWGTSLPTIFPVINLCRGWLGFGPLSAGQSTGGNKESYDKKGSGYLQYGNSRKTTARNTMIVPNHGSPKEHSEAGLDNLELLERDGYKYKTGAHVKDVERGNSNDSIGSSNEQHESRAAVNNDLVVQQRVDISVTESARNNVPDDNESELQVKHLH